MNVGYLHGYLSLNFAMPVISSAPFQNTMGGRFGTAASQGIVIHGKLQYDQPRHSSLTEAELSELIGNMQK